MGDQTLDMTIHVRHITEKQAAAIEDKIADAVVEVTGSVPSTSSSVTPDYTGPGRSAEETARAAAEGRR